MFVNGAPGYKVAYVFFLHIDGFMQDCSSSNVLAMELLQTCTKPSTNSRGITDVNFVVIEQKSIQTTKGISSTFRSNCMRVSYVQCEILCDRFTFILIIGNTFITWSEFNLIMMTSSNKNIFRVTGPLCGEFTGPGEFPTQRPVTRSFDVFFHLRLNKRLSKQPWGWWFDTPSWSLWRQCNDT